MTEQTDLQFYDWLSSYYDILFPMDSPELKAMWNKARNFLEENNVRRVLDVACGIGRNSVVLSQLGYEVTGIDLSEKSIAKAKRISSKRGLDIHYQILDMRQLSNLKSYDKFDLVICLGNSIAYMMKDRELRLAFEGIYNNLGKDGIILLDNRNFERILSNWKEHRFVYVGLVEEGEEKYVIVNVREKGPARNQITFKFLKIPVRGNNQRIETRSTVYRALMQEELIEALKATGFKHVELFGSLDFRSYNRNEDNLMVLRGRK